MSVPNSIANSFARDWFIGDDPGHNAWYFAAPDGTLPTTASVTAATVTVYDLTARPTSSTAGPALTVGAAAGSNAFVVTPTAVLSALWSRDDVGFNLSHYLRDTDFAGASAFIAGHSYRFVYVLTTAVYDAAANHWGKITLIREGTCKAQGGLI